MGWCQTVPSEGNRRLVLRLDPLIRTGLEARAMSRGVSLNDLAKFVLVEYVKQAAEAREGTPALLRHLHPSPHVATPSHRPNTTSRRSAWRSETTDEGHQGYAAGST